jgi:hypothetical protein
MWIYFFSKSGELGEKGRNYILQVEIWRIGRKRSKSYSSGRNLANFQQEQNNTDVSATVSLTD